MSAAAAPAKDPGLHRIRAEMDAAFASMSDAIWIADAGGQTLRVNDAFLRSHGFPGEYSGHLPLAEYFKLFEVFSPEGEVLDFKQWPGARALRGESASSQVFEVQRRDTGRRWIISCSYAPILSDIDGHICGAVVTSRDITEQFRMQRELEASRTRLRRLLAAQHSAAETERRRIALDLHDDLQQQLAAIRIELAMALGCDATDPDEVGTLMRRAHDMTGDALDAVRRIVRDLRPRILDGIGLAGALRSLLDGFGERARIDCRFIAGGADDDNAWLDGDQTLDSELAVTLYRVAQEALTNIHKHAGAESVELRLDLEDPALVRLTIRDDGVGVSAQDLCRNHSLGILGMQERLVAHGGRLSVRAAPDGGTIVEAIAPVTSPPGAERERERERDLVAESPARIPP